MSPVARATAALTAVTAAAVISVAALASFADCTSPPAAAAAAAASSHSPVPAVFLRSARELGASGGCVYENQWHRMGAAVPTRDACLKCACGAGALQCRRRACTATPVPPPRCHLRYRRGACCPELHCPDGITVLENEASARLEDEEDIFTAISPAHVCLEDGAVWAAGSALSAHAACESCFCLRGRRQCVRPRCLPPPPHCHAPPSPGACCPHRYYCNHNATIVSGVHKKHDCEVDGVWASEGERVVTAERDACTRCFCLHGAVHCQPPACAPPVPGCHPLLRPGDCCPHQYICNHHSDLQSIAITQNALEPEINEDRSLHSPRTSKTESTTRNIHSTNSININKTSKSTLASENLITTTKVKRKTSDPPLRTTEKQVTTTKQSVTTNQATAARETTTAKPVTTSARYASTSEAVANTVTSTPASSSTMQLSTIDPGLETTATDQPEGSVKIVINGTINCTAELSSTAVPANETVDQTVKIIKESISRVSAVAINGVPDTHTESPVDIITNGYMGDGLGDGDSFTINVTSSLSANNNRSTTRTTDHPKLTTSLTEIVNITNKKTKGDYDYDYAEPTLPPSLPNLKIIPFVAADAVVDDEPPKENPYVASEREDKFPVYFPSIDTKDSYTAKREEISSPTQYPVFNAEKTLSAIYPPVPQNTDFSSNAYPSAENDVGDIYHEYTITASLGNRIPVHKAATKAPITTTTHKVNVETPAVNLFSPPVETEGGFIPKGPGGIIDEYFAVYPSTPPPLPHLTTSMQLDNTQGECLASNGQRVMEGDSISFACSVCSCAWGELRCLPRTCHTPAGCTRRPAAVNSADLCCGQLVCGHDNKTAEREVASLLPSRNTEVMLNVSKIPEISTNHTIQVSISNSTSNNVTINKPTSLNVSKVTEVAQHQNSTVTDILTTALPHTTIKDPSTDGSISDATVTITTTPESKVRPTSTPLTTTTTASSSTDYEEEEEEDDGLSFGSVLKLLLSETYETTTVSSKNIYASSTTARPSPTKRTPYPPTATHYTTTTTRKPTPISAEPFKPIAHRYPYTPPKISPPHTSVNKIDHLVLGEATAIKKSTPRPPPVMLSTVPFKPIQPTTTSTLKPIIHFRPNDIKDEQSNSLKKQSKPTTVEVSVPSSAAPPLAAPEISTGGGAGLLKLAGCNIYGRMYRVGRIITELSSPCQECRCTDQGVQCRPLAC